MDYDSIRALIRRIALARRSQPEVALIEARKAVEALCQAIWTDDTGTPFAGRPQLEKMATEIEKADSVPREISVAIRTVQHYGNLAAHDGEQLSPDASAACLAALASVVRWYLRWHLPPGTVRHMEVEQALGQLGRTDFDRRYRTERLSLPLSFDVDDDMVDRTHRYRRIRRVDILDAVTGDFRSYRWLSVTNESDEPSHCLHHCECGETKIRFAHLGARAHLTSATGPQLDVADITKTQPNFVQQFAIHFPSPVKPGQELDLFYRLGWPAEGLAYPDHEHSQSIALGRYWQGVGATEFAVLSNAPIAAVRATRITPDYQEVPAQVQPTVFTVDDDPELQPLSGQGLAGYSFRFPSDDVLGYRILYRPQVMNETLDEF
jgi:hypothetical protein